jgi:hypothetical protein
LALPPTFDEFVAARLEALLRAQQRWKRIAAMDNPFAYVKRMVTNEYLSWRRRRASRDVALSLSDLDLIGSPVTDPTRLVDERDAMLAAIAQLPRKRRAAIVGLGQRGDRRGARLHGRHRPWPDIPRAGHPACRRDDPTRHDPKGVPMTDLEELIGVTLRRQADHIPPPGPILAKLQRPTRRSRAKFGLLLAATTAVVAVAIMVTVQQLTVTSTPAPPGGLSPTPSPEPTVAPKTGPTLTYTVGSLPDGFTETHRAVGQHGFQLREWSNSRDRTVIEPGQVHAHPRARSR